MAGRDMAGKDMAGRDMAGRDMAGKTVKVGIDKRGVATVTLNRPDRNNAYDGDMIGALVKGVAKLGADPKVRIVVLRGAGRHFQAGADLGWIQGVRAGTARQNIAVSQATTDAVHGLTAMPKPVLALVHGGCFGGGTGIVSACDIVLADRTAIFSITEARWGLIATPIVPQLISRIGPGRTRRYSLTCERFGADRALEIGLVDEVCDPGGLDALAEPIIDALLHCAPEALAQSKASILKYSGLHSSELDRADMALPHAMKRLTDEAEEGLASFLERRKPNWYPTDEPAKPAKAEVAKPAKSVKTTRPAKAAKTAKIAKTAKAAKTTKSPKTAKSTKIAKRTKAGVDTVRGN